MKLPEELLREREQRINDAISLKEPDRIPVAPYAQFFPARYGGLTCREAMYEYDRLADAWKKTVTGFEWDAAPPAHIMLPGKVFDLLDLKLFRWPGHGLPNDVSFQFVEDEYMKADEYEEILGNLGEFVVRKLLPRFAGALESFSSFPDFSLLIRGYNIFRTAALAASSPDFAQSMEALIMAGREMNKWSSKISELHRELTGAGFPILFIAFAQSPFDIISEFLRGFKGSSLDMYKNPEELLALIDLLTPGQIGGAISAAKGGGNSRVFIPLHRGAAGFMSEEQFEEFYWPSLKKIFLELIKVGLTPLPFFEGDYGPRLEYLRELPKGKIIGHFDRTDVFKAKEIIGDVICIKGNVPASLLCTRSPREVEEYCKRLIDIVGEGGGFIMDGAVNGIPDEAKPENVKTMTDFTKSYGVYRK